MDYGKSLKSARKRAGFTQKALAGKAGVATITIQQYEAGKRKPSSEIWFAIADALNLSIDELNNADLLPTRTFNPQKTNWANIPYISDDEPEFRAICEAFSHLNEKGQLVAVERVEELTKIPDYKRPRPQYRLQPHRMAKAPPRTKTRQRTTECPTQQTNKAPGRSLGQGDDIKCAQSHVQFILTKLEISAQIVELNGLC